MAIIHDKYLNKDLMVLSSDNNQDQMYIFIKYKVNYSQHQ